MNPLKSEVLVLNRNWQAVRSQPAHRAFKLMCKDAATALNIENKDEMYPVKWEDWINLPVRNGDQFISSSKLRVRVPKVIILQHYDKMFFKEYKYSNQGVWERDKGTCQYCGKKLRRPEGNIDHVIPRDLGGKTTWENCVVSCMHENSMKANRTPEQAGLKLIRKPEAPKKRAASLHIRNPQGYWEWDMFLKYE